MGYNPSIGQGSSYVRPTAPAPAPKPPAPKPPTPTYSAPAVSTPSSTPSSSGGSSSSSSSSSSLVPQYNAAKANGFVGTYVQWGQAGRPSGAVTPTGTSSSSWNIGNAQAGMSPTQIANLPSGGGNTLNFGQEGLPVTQLGAASRGVMDSTGKVTATSSLPPTSSNVTFGQVGGALQNSLFGTGKTYGGNDTETEIIPEVPGDPANKDKPIMNENENVPTKDDSVIMSPENPFEEGSTAADLWEQMKGIINPFVNYSKKREEELNKQKGESTDFINAQANLKNDILMRQLATEQKKRDVGIQKVRGGTKAQEMALEEGRKRALRYLKGALAQRGAFSTTGTGKFSLAALTGQYDIKSAEMKQAANNAIMDLNMKFDDLTTQIQNNQLLNENDKTKLILELNQTTANAIDAIMRDLANQEVNLGTSAFTTAYAADQAAAERQRQKEKELRDYFMKKLEMGEYVDPVQLEAVTKGDPVLEALAIEARRTGREYDSRAVTGVYEAMLGPAWATKINPRTGNTFKDDATWEVVRLVQEEHWTLEDALNRVRNAIRTSPEFQAYQAAGRSSGGSGGSGSSGKVTSQYVVTDALGNTTTFGYMNGTPVQWMGPEIGWVPQKDSYGGIGRIPTAPGDPTGTNGSFLDNVTTSGPVQGQNATPGGYTIQIVNGVPEKVPTQNNVELLYTPYATN